VGHRIERVLRVLFMENVLLSVIPVGVSCRVTAALLNGFVHFQNFWVLLLCLFALLSIMNCIGGGCKFHLMGVNNFAFFLQVERQLMVLHV